MVSPSTIMKFLVVGYGSIGRRHVSNLAKIIAPTDILICRLTAKQPVPGYRTFFDLPSALAQKPDAAIIATPASTHIRLATACAKAKTHLLIEKPLADSLKNINQLKFWVKKNNLTVLIGCNLRFHPGLIKTYNLLQTNKIGKIISVLIDTGQYLPDWRPAFPYQKTSSASRELGGGVILDLIHEIDYLSWFFGQPTAVTAAAGKKSRLKINTEDHADILLKYPSDIHALVHLDYLQKKPVRRCKIISEHKVIECDLINWPNYDKNDMYVAEIKHFMACLNHKAVPKTNLIDGINDLKTVLAIKKSTAHETTCKI